MRWVGISWPFLRRSSFVGAVHETRHAENLPELHDLGILAVHGLSVSLSANESKRPAGDRHLGTFRPA